MTDIPDGAYIEIVERTPRLNDKIIVPNEVRINGTPLLCPEDGEIVVHGVATGSRTPVEVTLTLYARCVEYKQEQEQSHA